MRFWTDTRWLGKPEWGAKEMRKKEGKKHTHRYKTMAIDSRGTSHQGCRCGEKRTILQKNDLKGALTKEFKGQQERRTMSRRKADKMLWRPRMKPGLALMVRAGYKYPIGFINEKLEACADRSNGCDRCPHESRCRRLHDLRVDRLDILCPNCGRAAARAKNCPWCNASFKGLRAIRQEICNFEH